jgi:hypothetical protein
MQTHKTIKWFAFIFMALLLTITCNAQFDCSMVSAADGYAGNYEIHLKSRHFTPPEGLKAAMKNLQETDSRTAPPPRIHVLMQFYCKPDARTREKLTESGVKLLNHIPNNCWFASIPIDLDTELAALSTVRWIGRILPEDKLSPVLLDAVHGDRTFVKDGKILLNIKYFTDIDPATLRTRIERLSVTVTAESPMRKAMSISLAPENIMAIARDDAVRWIEPPGSGAQPESDRVRSHIQIDQAQNLGLTGNGIRIGQFESAHVFKDHPDFDTRVKTPDMESGEKPLWHATNVAGIIGGNGSKSDEEFGTLDQWRGMAPGVEIYSYDFSNSTDFESDLADAVKSNEIHIASNSWGDSSCATYGEYINLCPFLDDVVHGDHTSPFGGKLPIVFSVGNDRDGYGDTNTLDCSIFVDKTGPFKNYGTINQPKVAKNIITVGAVDSLDNAMTVYSSWGPTADGRIKPDMVASGLHDGLDDNGVSEPKEVSCRLGGSDYITPTYDDVTPLSGNHSGADNQNYLEDDNLKNFTAGALCGFILTNTTAGSSCIIQTNTKWGDVYCKGDGIIWNNGDAYTIDRQYGCFGQTSNAAAATTGALALLLEDYYSSNDDWPLSSTLKALLIHTAEDLNDSTSWYNKGPDYASGYGLLRIQDAIQHLRTYNFVENNVWFRQTNVVWPQEMHYGFTVPAGTSNVKVTLVWDDEPGTENASHTLVNDLDLILRNPEGGIHYPWTLDPDNPETPAVRTGPDHINNVEQVLVDTNVISGNWEAIVIGTEINDVDGYQAFSLVGPAFTPGLNCDQAIELNEKVPYSGETSTFYESNVMSYPPYLIAMDGPEAVHKITTTSQGDLHVALTDTTGNLGAFLLSDCDPLTTIDWAIHYWTVPVATYEDAPAGTYYIVVDSPEEQSGQYTLTAGLNDADFDGIEDYCDTEKYTFSNEFSELTTYGKIIDRGDQILTIKDAPDSAAGLLIKADEAGGSVKASVEVCNGLAIYELSAGDEIVTTCSTVTTMVTKGEVEMTLYGVNGKIATANLSEPDTLIFDEATFTVSTPSSNTGPVIISVDDKQMTLAPGDSKKVFETATVDIDPDTLYLESMGKWITCEIQLPESYHVEDLDVQTLMLENSIPSEKSSIEDSALIVKFSRKDVTGLIEEMGLTLPTDVSLTLTSQNDAGTIFEGEDTIRVLKRAK